MDAQEMFDLVAKCGEVTAIGFPPAAQSVGLFTTLGSIFLMLVNRGNSGSQLAGELSKLNGAVTRLGQEMRQEFRGMEALIKDLSFTQNIVNKIGNQERFLENMITTRSRESVDQFKHECNQHRPQSLLSDIIESIEKDVTNPIGSSLNANPFNSKELMNKWRRQIENLAGILARIHGLFCGLNEWKDDGTMAKNIRKLEKVLNEFEGSFKLDYWPAVTQLVETTMDTRTDLWNDKKADILKEKLNNMYTTDQFYIIVYDEVTGHDKHSFRAISAQTLYRYRRGGCNMVVYASKTSHETSEKDYYWLKDKVDAWRDGWIPSTGNLDGKVGEIWDHINWQGFVGLIRKEHNPIIRSTGRDWEWGPGWWITAHGKEWVKYPNSRGAITMPAKDTILIVGMK